MLNWLRLDTGNSDLVRAQLDAYSRLVPILYVILMVDAATVAVTHVGVASSLLTLYTPLALVVLCATRLVYWVRVRDIPVDAMTAAKRLQAATVAGGFMGIAFLAWVTALYFQGTSESRAHLSVVVGITGVAGIFGMMHVRPAAIVIAILLALPYSLFLATRSLTEAMIGINIALAIIGVLIILKRVSADFRSMVLSQLETQRLSDENLRLANRDNLTDLPNRRYFFNELEARLVEADDGGALISVGVIDLDGFKPINDTYGHVAGDQVLCVVARRLERLSSNMLVARLGGDEFGLIVHAAPADLAALGKTICDSLREPIMLEDLIVHVSASVGFASMNMRDDSAMSLYERADYALYHAKQSERGSTVLFDQSHQTAISREVLIERTLRMADLDAELSLQFQPVMDVAANRVVGFEALARWHSPTLGLVPPGAFIPIAERTERIHAVTHCLLRKALATAAKWDDELGISFNLSVRDLLSPTSILQIISIVNASGLRPGRIDFEITETALMSDFNQAQSAIRVLKALGVCVSLDDFGTGYSSLSYVHRLPFDKIKIDRSFISDIERTGASQTIVRSVVDLCRSLDIDCIVEGMETHGQKEVLMRLGCNSMQGFYFSYPMNEADIMRFLHKTEDRAALYA